MRRRYILQGLLLAFVAFQFTSCENEPLTGTFQQEEETNTPEEGQFVATIEGAQFVATTVSAVMTPDNKLTVSGEKPNGERITLMVMDAAEGNFNITNGYTNPNYGSYGDPSGNNIFPYKSVDTLGGVGQLIITEIDTANKTVSGTFGFTGARLKRDGDGNVILDNQGTPIVETTAITNGAFEAITYIIDETGGGNEDPENEFFAKVDGQDFMADNITVTEPMVGNVHMIKVEATDAQGALIRLDIPRFLGEGTFDMVNLSDGTQLIGVYNAGGGGENLTSNPGTITISEFNLETGVLKATFQFTATDPLNQEPDVVEITEGNFTVFFEGVPGANNAFFANIDGAPYEPEGITVETEIVNQYPRLIITTTRGDEKMVLSLPLTVSEDTYEMGTEVTVGDEIVATYTPEVGTSITYVSDPGSLVITGYDLDAGTIEGIFNFTARDATSQDPTIYQITAGEFFIVLP